MVITVDPQNASALTSGVVILSQKHKVELALSSFRTSQCINCWRYGHANQRCPATNSTCPICGLHHTRAAHRCQNPTCPRSGNNKPVPSCCPPPCPPIAATAVMTTLPRSGSVQLDLPRLSLPEQTRQPPPRSVKSPWIWRSMAAQHPLLPPPGRVPLSSVRYGPHF